MGMINYWIATATNAFSIGTVASDFCNTFGGKADIAQFRRDHGILAHRARAAELFSPRLSQFEASWVKKLFDRKLPIG